MDKILKLLESYSKGMHLEIMSEKTIENRINMDKFAKIYSENWTNSTNEFPYVEATHMLDSYYCLPERPDMAFTFLWKAINSAYNKNYYKQLQTNVNVIRKSDSGNLDLALFKIKGKLKNKIKSNNTEIEIQELIEKYAKKIPVKTLRFIAGYILKGIVINTHFTGVGEKHRGTQYNTSHYTSFKKKFSDIHESIEKTYGEEYKKICTIRIDSAKSKVVYNIKDKERSRSLTHSLAKDLKELIEEKSVKIFNGGKTNEYSLKFKDNNDYLDFIFKNVLYAIRNSSVHGNEASRLDSITMTVESMNSSNYIYLLGYLFLSLLLYINEDIEVNDLSINLVNYDLI